MTEKPTPLVIEREFGMSHGDFHRIFPRVEPTAVRVAENSFEVRRDDGRRLSVTVSAEKIRRLATLKIPYVDVAFEFEGWSEEQRAEFFEKFDRSFQKGGG